MQAARKLLTATALLSGLTMAMPASAAVIFGTGNPGNQGTDNVVFNSCSGASQSPGLTVQGCLNTSSTTLVNFTSNENLVVNGGQARIDAQDGSFQQLAIDLVGYTFNKLILNIDVVNGQTGTVTFTATPGGTSTPFALGNGSNFFYVEGTAGEAISQLSFTTTIGIAGVQIVDDVQQVRVGGVLPTSVPEPASMALLGMGLLGLGASLRRRRR